MSNNLGWSENASGVIEKTAQMHYVLHRVSITFLSSRTRNDMFNFNK